MKHESTVEATLKKQASDRYMRIPFTVPVGSESVEVTIDFDGDLASIDLGCEGANDWRGWSGGARRTFVITEHRATPGYVPAPLEPGEWNVILGLHKLPPSGVTVDVSVSIPAGREPEDQPLAEVVARETRGSDRDLPAPPGLTWFAGDFHGHTHHSDGALSISQLAALGAQSGLDFLTVTDHNTVAHHPHLPGVGRRHDITLIPGQEVTTHRGHANAFGDIGWIDFREPADRWVQEVEKRGGILSINHPIASDCSWLHQLTVAPAAVELWHSTWFEQLSATSPLAWFRNWDQSATLLGGSDFHRNSGVVRPGTPVTWVAATECTPQAILEGVAAGRTAITGGVRHEGDVLVPELFDTPALVRVGADLVAMDARDTVLIDGSGRRQIISADREVFRAARSDGPFQLVHADRSVVALSA